MINVLADNKVKQLVSHIVVSWFDLNIVDVSNTQNLSEVSTSTSQIKLLMLGTPVVQWTGTN